MIRRLLVALLLVACGLAAGMVLMGRLRQAAEADAQQRLPVAVPGPAAPAATLTDFSRIAERTVPAVVNISAQQVVRRRVIDPFSSFFFGGDDIFSFRRGVENSVGSGVIVGADGYILTNNHVVTGDPNQSLTIEQLDVTVTLSDKREMRADVVGVDPATDLALLKVDAIDLPTMPWGDSSTLKVAEWVLAIGNPYQLSQTVTLGIVSAVGRTNLGVSTYEDFIQTDAAINPGNSGGALVNARGELVGINTFIFSQSGGYQGIGFAVSSNLARRVFNDLRQYGEVRRGSIGLTPTQYVTLTTRYAEELGAPDTRGALVVEMYRNSPAYRAGIRPGDVIVSVNGTPVEDPGHLTRLISDAPIDSTATVGVIRNGRRLEFRVRVIRTTTAAGLRR
ncbi:MAG TPA: trypsin-like peptidase domain-containing protein [Vicinamibacterales bacterium]|nr:trypsin-like peptidase domain-containing protein [Vicinamibacterales bacterium]